MRLKKDWFILGIKMKKDVIMIHKLCCLLRSKVIYAQDGRELMIPENKAGVTREDAATHLEAYEADLNCVVLLERVSKREACCLQPVAELLCQCVCRALKHLYPKRHFAVYAILQAGAGFRIQFHQVWEDRPLEAVLYGESSKEIRIRMVTDIAPIERKRTEWPVLRHPRQEVSLLLRLTQLLQYGIIQDTVGNELVCIADVATGERIDYMILDKTAYEAVNNHVHLVDDITDYEHLVLAADAEIMCLLIYANLKFEYPKKRFAVFATVQRHDSFVLRFHQIWKDEQMYYMPSNISESEYVFAMTD